jgi:hypothetical protein
MVPLAEPDCLLMAVGFRLSVEVMPLNVTAAGQVMPALCTRHTVAGVNLGAPRFVGLG